MATAFDLFGIDPNATRDELDAAYAAKRAAYDSAHVAGLGVEFEQLAAQRRAELAAAYHRIRSGFIAPPRMTQEQERRRDRELLCALLLLAALAALIPFLQGAGRPERTAVAENAATTALISQLAPPFTLETLDGRTMSLSDYQGKIVMITIWATWCPPCVRETPRLVNIYNAYKDQGFVMLGINTTYQDKRDLVERFVEEQGITYPILLDQDGKVGAAYGGRLMPTSYLIDRTGKIVVTKVGEVDEIQLREQVRALLRNDPL